MRLFRTVLLLSVLAGTGAAAQDAPLRITYLANMGVLLESGGQRVVIDGFHRGALSDYAGLPPSLQAALEEGRAPYAELDLILTTHRHLDHYDSDAVAARLLADSVVAYIAAQETVDTLVAQTALPAGHPRVHPAAPPRGGTELVEAGGLEVAVLDLPHGPNPRVVNVGFLLTLGGKRVLHVGDAYLSPATFTGHQLTAEPIDVGIVPFWYLTEADASVRRAIGARRWIATHVSPAAADQIRRQVLVQVPEAVVFTTTGQEVVIE